MNNKLNKISINDSVLYVYSTYNSTQDKINIYSIFYTKTDIDNFLLNYYT